MSADPNDFVPFPKIPRLYKGSIWITEKIDGTNAQVCVERYPVGTDPKAVFDTAIPGEIIVDHGVSGLYRVRAGSRNRWLSPGKDNHGFFAWVSRHAGGLIALGEGRHYGEWWGQGIQGGYGQSHKFFSLFNTGLWYDPSTQPRNSDTQDAIPGISQLSVVPILYVGPWFSTGPDPVKEAMRRLQFSGSTLNPEFPSEGVVVYHEGSGSYMKAPFRPEPKGQPG